MTKKVLIITYHWPPSGGISVLRCLKIAKYLSSFGWEPIIYKPKNAQYEFLDSTNNKDIPKDITILEHSILEPFNVFKKLSGRKKNDSQNPVYVRDRKQKRIDKLAIWVRANFFIPDARSLWIKPSVKYLSKYLKENKVDAIFSDGPPHTNTAIASKLVKKFNIPWLADFQDPWTQVDYYKMFPISKRAHRKHSQMEQETFARAKKITIASPSWAKDLEDIGANNVSPIYYGYDEDDYASLNINEDGYFSFVHAGLLGIDRSPDTLIKALSDIKKENHLFGEKLKIRLAGLVDYSIIQKMEKAGLKENLEYVGKRSRSEAIDLIFNGKILLLPLNKADNVKGRIPGKLFELLRVNKPILCLGPNTSDTSLIIKNTEAGTTINYDNYNELKEFINLNFENFISGNFKGTTKNIEEYSNYNQTKKVAQFLDAIV